jgi:hypothetical protein
MDPGTIALLTAIIGGVSQIGGAALDSGKPKETATQEQRRNLVDELLSSLGGQGKFGDLFNLDEDAFQKSIVDPAKSRFENQIAPQIQQGFIASGQQRGTGLDDTLSRAGVDLDQLINEQFLSFQEGGRNRQAGALNAILGGPEGVQPGLSTSEKFRGAAGGFLGSDEFSSSISDILGNFIKKTDFDSESKRKGFA